VILWLSDPGAADPGRTGGKGASLARLKALGFAVPDGFCLTFEAFEAFERSTAVPDPSGPETPTERRERLCAAELPADVVSAIDEAYSALASSALASSRPGSASPAGPAVVVRSLRAGTTRVTSDVSPAGVAKRRTATKAAAAMAISASTLTATSSSTFQLGKRVLVASSGMVGV